MSSESAELAFLIYRRTGEPDALGEVFDALAPELLLVAVRIAAPGIDAEDLVQRTFLAAIEKADRFEPGRPLSAWLLGILVKFALAEQRRSRRRLNAHRLTTSSAPLPAAVAEAHELAAAASPVLSPSR